MRKSRHTPEIYYTGNTLRYDTCASLNLKKYVSVISIQFNILLERAQQRRDPNYKHTVTFRLIFFHLAE
jgi:hypothetical protein